MRRREFINLIGGVAGKRQGLNIRETYIDPGVSGVTLDRPALQRLIADCRVGKIGTVVTKDHARLSRDTAQLFALLHIFAAAQASRSRGSP
jgi:DNA invertase Pin-like site-specific DNA recombinase